MSEENDHQCEMCDITRKAFGDRFKGCADISNKLAEKAIGLMKREVTSMTSEIVEKNANGELTKDEFEKLKDSIEKSFVFGASLVPAVAIVEGADINPAEMKSLVERSLFHLVMRAMEAKMGEEGPAGILAAILGIAQNLADSDEAEDEEPEEPEPDPNLN